LSISIYPPFLSALIHLVFNCKTVFEDKRLLKRLFIKSIKKTYILNEVKKKKFEYSSEVRITAQCKRHSQLYN